MLDWTWTTPIGCSATSRRKTAVSGTVLDLLQGNRPERYGSRSQAQLCRVAGPACACEHRRQGLSAACHSSHSPRNIHHLHMFMMAVSTIAEADKRLEQYIGPRMLMSLENRPG